MVLTYETCRYLLCGAVGLTLALGTYAIASAPSRIPSRLGMRGLKRRRSIEHNPAWGSVEPLVRWLGVRISGVVSDELRAKLEAQIGLAGDYLGISADEYLALAIVGLLGGILFGVIAGYISGLGSLVVVICTSLGAALPYMQVTSESARRLKQINRGLPFAVDLMALAMSAGLDFPGAIRQVVEKSSDPEDALIEELTRILQELQLGRTRRQALLEFGARAPTNQVTEFVNAVIQAEERGNPVADVLLIQAGVSRQRRSVMAEETAAKAGVQMVGPLFLLFGCIMLLVVAPIVIKLAAAE
ncbi:MAG: type II secretion system F family protein [Polyangiales bacterium]